MKLRTLRYTIVLIALFGFGFLLRASLPSVTTGTWVAAGNMSASRSGACTVALTDGRLLVSGGADTNGPTATANLFSTSGSWSTVASMNSPRSHQSCALLEDGRVLVTGGTTSGGGITNTAEIYDPNADSWGQAGLLNDARTGATASVLQDGRVLIAGGQSSAGALNTLEIFDPNSGSFSNAGTMSSPREDHAATVLSDGRVLIVGGSSDGANALSTTEIFDPQAGSVSAGPAMSTPRVRHTVTTLLDGTVIVIGGSDYTNDLGSAELFDPAANDFNTTSNLATARSKQSAFLLPNSNEVLVVGGQTAGTDLASAELYIPWQKAFQATGAMATPRSDATGAPLTHIDGRLLMAGGSSASAELYGFATVKTDAADYPPGTTVTITGSGWQPGETVALTLVESPLYDTHGPYTTIADAFGNISDSSFITDAHDLDIRFYLTAVGSQSQAQNTFTDAKPNTVTVGTQSPNPVGPVSSATFPITVNFNGSGSSCTSPLSVTTALPAGATASFNPGSVTSTGGNSTSTLTISTTNVTPPGSTTFTVLAGNGGGTCQAGTASNTGTLVVVENTTTTLTSSVNPSTFGQSTTLNATVGRVTGPTTPNAGTVTFKDGAITLGSAALNASGIASLPVSILTAGSHNLTASYAGTALFAASDSNTVAQTVTAANTTTTVSNASGTFGGPAVTLSANVTANSPSTASVGEGTVTFTVKQGATTIGTVTSGTVAAGAATASFSLSGISSGSYTINATYNPAASNPNFNSSAAAAAGTLNVNKADTTTTVGNASGTTGASANLTASVTANTPSTAAVNEGTVTFSVKQGAVLIGTATSGTVTAGAASASLSLAGIVSGTYTISATYNPAATPNFNTSTAATAGTLTVNNPLPTATGISPSSKNVGDTTFTLTVNGTNFVSNSVVNFAGSPRTTAFVNGTQLTASIPASDLTAAGTFNITVTNPAPGSGTSNAQTFTVNNVAPTATSISPASRSVTDAAFTLTVNGTNFLSSSTVNFNGSPRTTTFVNATQVTAAIPVTDLATAGSFNITVTNPAPGGGTSNPQTFTVNPKLAITSAAFGIVTGTCSSQVTAQTQNQNNSAANQNPARTLNLSSDSGTAKFFSDAACSAPNQITSAQIASGASTVSFFYSDTTSGNPTMTVASTGLTSAAQAEVIDTLRFQGAAFSVQTNQCSAGIVIQAVNPNPTPVTQSTPIALSSSSPTGKFYNDAACTTQITSTPIAPGIDGGHDTNSFFYKDPSAGAPILTASAGSASTQQIESVVAPPGIAKAFGATAIAVNGTTSLTFTITNPAVNSVALAGVAFTDTFPAGLVVATPTGLTSTCGGTATATAGSGSVSLTAGTVAANNSCTLSVNVKATTSGVKNNTTGAVSSTNGGSGNTASASVTVATPPSIAKSFGAASIPLNASTSLTFNITNPNTIGLTGVAFSDSLPAGLVVASPSNLSSTCNGTTAAVAGSSSISLSAGTLGASASCAISLNVTGTTTGTKNNTTGAITSAESGPGATSNTASVTVNARATSTTISPLTATTAIGQGSNFIVTVTDTNSSPASTPAGTVTVSSSNGSDTIGTCTLTQTVVGTAACSATVTPAAPTGTHTISAAYVANDSIHLGSSTTTNAALTVINPATNTQVVSSLNPSTFGQSVSITATVTSAAGTPTGGVTFFDGACGATALTGPLTLDGNGQATFSTASLNAGTHNIFACYTHTGIFLDSSSSVSQLVNQATPSITWANPADITYGTLLSGTQLNATASVPGAFAYVPAAGTLLNAGPAQLLSTVFTPADPVDFATVSAAVQINVNQATPLIVWNNPADINYGTALGSQQLNAIALPIYSLRGWWKAETDATDSVAGNDGALQGGTTYTAGEAGQAFSFPDALSDGVTIPYNGAYDMNAPGFTASFWMQGSPNSSGMETVFEKSYGAGDNTGWAFQVNASTGKLEFDIGEGNASSPSFTQIVSSGSVLDGNFHHIVGTWNGSTKMTLFVDGISQGNGNLAAAPANNSGGLNIGFSMGSGTPGQFFQGAVDEVQIFAQTLPAGSYSYTPASGTVLSAADGQSLSVLFAPDDSTNLTTANKTVTINVKKANQTITFAALADKTYGDAPFTVSATGGGSGNPVTFTASPVNVCTSSAGMVTIIGAGACIVTADQLGDSNYNPAASVQQPFTINPKPVTATITASDKTYDGTKTATITSCSIPGKVGTDDVGCTVSGAMFASANASVSAQTVTATVALTGTTAGNYTLGGNTTATTTATINPKPVTATIAAADKTYDGTKTATITSCSIPGKVGTDDVGCTANGAMFASANASVSPQTVTATVALTGTTAGNYTLGGNTTATTTATINPKPVTVAFTATDKTYDGTNTATVSNCSIATGKVGNDNVTCVVANGTFASSNASASPQIVSATATLAGTDSGNYAVTNPVTTTAKINPATPVVMVTDPMPTYDANPHSASATAIGVDGHSTVPGTFTFTYDGSATPPTNAKTSYAVIATFTSGDSNYTNANGNGTLTINKAPSMTAITPASVNVTYDAMSHGVSALATGVGGLSQSVAIVYTPGGSTAPVNAGTYSANASYAGDANHFGSNATAVTITINAASPVFSGLSSPTITLATASTTLSGTIKAGTLIPPGSVTITVNGTAQVAAINPATGSFSSTFNTAAFPVSVAGYPISYSYKDTVDSNFNNATGTGTLNVRYVSAGTCDGDLGHTILQPINASGAMSVFKLGSTVPTKFRVCDANGVSIGAPGVVTGYGLVAAASSPTITVDEDSYSTTPDTTFRWDSTGQQWIFNQSTKNNATLQAGVTYYFAINLNDGSSIYFQYALK